MRRRLAFAVLLLAALSLAVTTSAGKPPAIKEIPVTVTFTDESGCAIRSDGYGPYANGVGGVTAVFVSAGNLALTTGSARRLLLDFAGRCSSGPCSPPWPSGTVTGFVSTSSCDNAGGLRDMPISSSQSCNLNVNFGTPGTGWFIRFGEYTGTDPAMVTRISDTSWEIDVPAGGVAKLLSYLTKGRMVLTDKGDFMMPAHLTVTQP
jgi:hypothetical protein